METTPKEMEYITPQTTIIPVFAHQPILRTSGDGYTDPEEQL